MQIEKARALHLEAGINRDEEMNRAAKRFPAAIWFAGAGAVVLLLLWGFRPRDTEARPTSPQPAVADTVASLPASGEFSVAGYIEPVPPFPVKITPLVPGRIDRFSLREGDAVKAGDEIARINSQHLENRAAELKAAMAVTAQRLEFAERELTRAQRLSARGVSPQRELDQAASEAGILRAEAARIQVELASVEWQIQQSIIRSPVDGILYQRTASEGDFINLDERHEIASVVDPARMQVWADVNQRDLARVRKGAPAMVSLEGESELRFPARVERILPRASLAKNTVRVVLQLKEFSPSLRPDMSVKITFSEP